MYLLIRHILLFGPWHLCSHVHLSQSSEKTPLFLFRSRTADSADVISPGQTPNEGLSLYVLQRTSNKGKFGSTVKK